jgi:DNA repair exonuclease SbcCD nuclease subunit
MRFLHCSDLHIGSSLNSRLSPLKTRERREELLLSFRRLIDEGEKEGVDGVIIAGDLLDTERTSKRTVSSIFSAIAAKENIEFFYLPGNHERDAIVKMGLDAPKNLHIFTKECPYFDFKDARILTLTENERGELYAPKKKEFQNVLVLHGEVSRGGDGIYKFDPAVLEGAGCDYIAMGHYHSYSATLLKGGTPVVYSGTPEGRGFDECGEKGYVILDMENGRTSYRFVARAMRKIYDLYLDLSPIKNNRELEEGIENTLKTADESDLVRLTLTGEYEPSLIKDTDALEYYLGQRFYYFELHDASRLKIDPLEYKDDKSLKGEFIRLVMGDESLTEGEKSDIIELGLRALSGDTLKR